MDYKQTNCGENVDYIAEVMSIMRVRADGQVPLAFVRTYGCQQNVADSEKIKGLLAKMGFSFTENEKQADLILFNTCAIREHAEDRVYGNLGALKALKQKKPRLLIGLCGCMAEQEHVAARIKTTFPFVNLVFGPHVLHRLPEMLFDVVTESRRVFLQGQEEKAVHEDVPIRRDGKTRAWVTAMYGCDNFCTYCIVPYVRGREKSRASAEIIREVEMLAHAGYKEITLLGQNVNSYGKGLVERTNFSQLLREIDRIPGDYRIRFMTSHPKDASEELFETIAQSVHIPHYIHLPVQSGNDRILQEMNRGYTREKYLSLIQYARSVMPDVSITSDIIVGFPGETEEEFEDTLSLVQEVGFTSLFTFIYSARKGTKAAMMPDPVERAEKAKRLQRLLAAQEEIARARSVKMVGRTFRVLVEDKNEKNDMLNGRADSSMIVEFPGDASLIGEFAEVKVTKARNWILQGERVDL